MAAGKLKQVRLKLPATPEAIRQLDIGNVVFLDGVVYTGREGVYKKVVADGASLPEGLTALSNANFHCSPAASIDADGTYRVGGLTATASFRFSQWMARLLELSGAKLIIGKGGMSEADYKSVLAPVGAVYLTTVGYGTGALLGRGVKRVVDVHWIEELGLAQAMWVFEVENFGPFLVDSDLEGRSLFEQQGREINAHIDQLYAGLKPPAMHRYGETDRKNEVI
jgi:L(+)-tartrate dehydratase beta subunit